MNLPDYKLLSDFYGGFNENLSCGWVLFLQANYARFPIYVIFDFYQNGLNSECLCEDTKFIWSKMLVFEIIVKNICLPPAASGWKDLIFPFPTTKQFMTEKLNQEKVNASSHISLNNSKTWWKYNLSLLVFAWLTDETSLFNFQVEQRPAASLS